ncbi:amidase family protein [Saccharothrix sp. Mg75]|uniref:amidase family protein n=1 Tax=Saccharothrix sp. Mg75 TaxID=3445357 RepID=UPI003EEB6AE9
MSWTPPTPADVIAHGKRNGLPLPASEAALYAELAGTFAAAHDAVELWHQETKRNRPDRAWQRPSANRNPFNAWYVTGSVIGTPDGCLADLTWVVKSNIAVAGWPMCAGSRLIEGYQPTEDATAVRLLLEAGAQLRGSANAEDLGLSASSHTSALGPVRNPWRNTHATFGSSSGCAALVSAGLVDFALGADQAGSVRLPGSGTGLVAHKPTRGVVPYTGAMPFTVAQDTLGVLARDVYTVTRAMAVLAERDGRDLRQGFTDSPVDWTGSLEGGIRGLRIGMLREAFSIPGLSEPAVDETVRATIARLTEAGATVTEVSVPEHTRGSDLAMMLTLKAGAPDLLAGNGGSVQTALHADPELVEHFAAARLANPQNLAATVALSATAGAHAGHRPAGWYLAAAMRLTGLLADAYDKALGEVDVLVTPTAPYLPKSLPGPDISRADWIGSALDMIVNTCSANLTGHPATQVPAGIVDGLPVGLQIIGPIGADTLCLRVAKSIEDVEGGFPAPPLQS